MKKVTNQNQNKNYQTDRKKNPRTISFVFNKIIMLFPLTNEKNVLSCFTLCMCAFNLHPLCIWKLLEYLSWSWLTGTCLFMSKYTIYGKITRKKKRTCFHLFCFVHKLCVINLHMEFEFWVHKDMFFGKSSVYCTDTAILYWDRLNLQHTLDKHIINETTR